MTPAEVAAAVLEATLIPDAQRCTVVTDGRRCVNPRAKGGEICEGHIRAKKSKPTTYYSQKEVERDYGPAITTEGRVAMDKIRSSKKRNRKRST